MTRDEFLQSRGYVSQYDEDSGTWRWFDSEGNRVWDTEALDSAYQQWVQAQTPPTQQAPVEQAAPPPTAAPAVEQAIAPPAIEQAAAPPSQDDYLRSLGFVYTVDGETGEGKWLAPTDEGGMSAVRSYEENVSPEQRLTATYDQAFTQDPSGNLIYGTAGPTGGFLGVTDQPQGGSFNVGGVDYLQTGADAATLRAAYPQLASLPLAETYDPQYGYGVSGPMLTAIQQAQARANESDFMTQYGPSLMMGLATAGIGTGFGAGAAAASGVGGLSNATLGQLVNAGLGLAGGADPLQVLASGAIGYGVGQLPGLTGNPMVDSAIKAGVSGAAKAAVGGGDPLEAALIGAAGSGLGAGFNQLVGTVPDAVIPPDDGFNVPGGQAELDQFMQGLPEQMIDPATSSGMYFPTFASVEPTPSDMTVAELLQLGQPQGPITPIPWAGTVGGPITTIPQGNDALTQVISALAEQVAQEQAVQEKEKPAEETGTVTGVPPEEPGITTLPEMVVTSSPLPAEDDPFGTDEPVTTEPFSYEPQGEAQGEEVVTASPMSYDETPDEAPPEANMAIDWNTFFDDPVNDPLQGWSDPGAGLGWDPDADDQAVQQYMQELGLSVGGPGASSDLTPTLQTLAKILFGSKGAANLASGGIGGLLGGTGEAEGLFGAGGAASLAARLGPGIMALNYAGNQGNVDTSPLSNLLGQSQAPAGNLDTSRLTGLFNSISPNLTTNTSALSNIANQYAGYAQPIDTSRFSQIYGQYGGFGQPFDTSRFANIYGTAGNLGRGFDTSGFSNLSGQVAGIMDPYKSSVLKDYDIRTGQARGELEGSLGRRGVLGSSFGNMDLGNFDVQSQNQRGMLAGNLGMQGINAQRGLAQDVLGAQQAARGFEQTGIGQQLQAGQQMLGAEQAARQFGMQDLAARSGLAQNMFNADLAQRELGFNALNAQRGIAQDVINAQQLDRGYGLNVFGQQRGLAQDILGAQNQDRTFGLNQLNAQSGIAQALLNAQLQQQGIRSGLYGRAFDVLGRAVSPAPSLFGIGGY